MQPLGSRGRSLTVNLGCHQATAGLEIAAWITSVEDSKRANSIKPVFNYVYFDRFQISKRHLILLSIQCRPSRMSLQMDLRYMSAVTLAEIYHISGACSRLTFCCCRLQPVSVCVSHHGLHTDGSEDHPTRSQEGNPTGAKTNLVSQ